MERLNLTSFLAKPGFAVYSNGPSFNYSALHPSGNFSTYVQAGRATPGGAGNQSAAAAAMENSTYYNIYELGPCMFNDTGCNITLDNITTPAGNVTSHGSNPYTLWQLIILGILAGGTSLLTILGNLIVILSFILERTIRQPTNYFIASLAVSDLLIGSFSMPFYTVYLLTGKYWPLGEILCDLWLALDYTVCLTSIYTVFCITIDRFCSVKIPAKYRSWRTDRKVNVIIAFTWIVPILVFFTSIFGWQYFVGKRTVPEGMCYVQYMEDALFNCILQIGYFWVTLTVMCILYTGIYKVALDLQKKSNAKQKKMTSLVSMAGQTMTKIGIGMSKQHQIDGNALFITPKQGQNAANNTSANAGTSEKKKKKKKDKNNSKKSKKNISKDDERSSSPAFPSDTDPSSQSPKRGSTPCNEERPVAVNQQHAQAPTSSSSLKIPGGAPPPVPVRNSSNSSNFVANNIADFPPPPPPLPQRNNTGYNSMDSTSPGPPPPPPPPPTPPTPPSPPEGPSAQIATGEAAEGAVAVLPPPPSYSDCVGANGDLSQPQGDTSDERQTSLAINGPPECISDVKYIDQDSLKSPLSNENFGFLEDNGGPAMGQAQGTKANAALVIQEPESPVWKKRTSFIEREMREAQKKQEREQKEAKHAKHRDYNHHHLGKHKKEKKNKNSSSQQDHLMVETDSHLSKTSVSGVTSSVGDSASCKFPTTSMSMETNLREGSRAVTKLFKPDEIQPLNADDGTSSQGGSTRRRGRNKLAGSPLKGIVKSISGKRSKRKKSKKFEIMKSKSENRARKALRTITIILGAFVICWTPWHILSMIIGFCPDSGGCVHDVLYDISYWLCYLNSPINPLCYAFANQQFKKTFIRIMRFDWHKT